MAKKGFKISKEVWKVPQNSDTFSTYPHHIREFFLEQIAAVTFQERYVFSSCCNS